MPRGYLYTTAVDPNTTMQVMFSEARRLQTEPIGEKELTGNKSVYLTGYLMQNESTDGQARFLGITEITGGDWHMARTLPDRIRAVKPADVQAFAKKYVGRMQTVVLGDPSKLDQKVFSTL
jgi:predicted Zn-dependent peptidase